MKTLSTALLLACDCTKYRMSKSFSTGYRFYQAAAEKLQIPPSENDPQPVSPKIENLVNEITKLTLFEVSELSTVLKKRLNLPDMPAMAFGAIPQGVAAAQAVEEEEVQPAKSSFTLKLTKYDDAKKVPLIKEIKLILSEMNLVQAKKFVEGAPVVVKSDISKDEADKLKETLEKVGGVCVVE